MAFSASISTSRSCSDFSKRAICWRISSIGATDGSVSDPVELTRGNWGVGIEAVRLDELIEAASRGSDAARPAALDDATELVSNFDTTLATTACDARLADEPEEDEMW